MKLLKYFVLNLLNPNPYHTSKLLISIKKGYLLACVRGYGVREKFFQDEIVQHFG